MQSQTHTFIINGSPMPCLQAADVGHLYPIEQPALFVQQLQRWLKQQA